MQVDTVPNLPNQAICIMTRAALANLNAQNKSCNPSPCGQLYDTKILSVFKHCPSNPKHFHIVPLFACRAECVQGEGGALCQCPLGYIGSPYSSPGCSKLQPEMILLYKGTLKCNITFD